MAKKERSNKELTEAEKSDYLWKLLNALIYGKRNARRRDSE